MRVCPRYFGSELVALALLALVAISSGASAGTCDYDIRLSDDKPLHATILAQCSGLTDIAGFRSAADPSYWQTNPDSYRSDRGAFTLNLDRLAEDLNDFQLAKRYGGGVLIAPELFLPLPETKQNATLRLRIRHGDKVGFATAVVPDSDGRFALSAAQIDEAGPFIVGNGFSVHQLAGDPELRLVVPDEGLRLNRDQLIAWASAASLANRRFWGRSPVEHGLIVIVPVPDGVGVPFGRVLSEGGALVTILVGENADTQSLLEDWVLVHELLHLGSPVMRDTGTWFNEGVATLYEPVLRARAGWKSQDDVWKEWMIQMPRGERAMELIGLSNAGRGGIYWGGAIFMLLAEIESLDASNGKLAFSDCLQEALANGGNVLQRWPSRRIINLCDKLLSTDRISRLFESHVSKGSPVDLDGLWRRLGIIMTDEGQVEYDDEAPLAWVRPYILWGRKLRPEPISSSGFHGASQ